VDLGNPPHRRQTDRALVFFDQSNAGPFLPWPECEPGRGLLLTSSSANDFTKKITAGLEYYGSVGPVTGFLALNEQQHQIFPAIDLNLSPKWEVNFGLGVGVTRATDHLIAKMIIGYRFNF
jgi:hypothetical protein